MNILILRSKKCNVSKKIATEPEASVTEESGQQKKKRMEKRLRKGKYLCWQDGLGGDRNEEETKWMKDYRVKTIWE